MPTLEGETNAPTPTAEPTLPGFFFLKKYSPLFSVKLFSFLVSCLTFSSPFYALLGFSVCPYEIAIGSTMRLPTVAGCVYFSPTVPAQVGQVITVVKVCSCSPLGILAFDEKALKQFNLVIGSSSLISFVATGPMISISLYSDSSFNNNRQLTIGPGMQVPLADEMRYVAVGSGKLEGHGPPTWDRYLK